MNLFPYFAVVFVMASATLAREVIRVDFEMPDARWHGVTQVASPIGGYMGEFNGNAWIDLDASVVADLDEHTVAFWFRVDGPISDISLFYAGQEISGLPLYAYQIELGSHPADSLYRYVNDGSAPTQCFDTVDPWPLGRLHHVAITSGLDTRCYVDGQLVDVRWNWGNRWSSQSFNDVSMIEVAWLGRGYPSGRAGWLRGAIDEFVIFDEVLSDQEIAALAAPGASSWLLMLVCLTFVRRRRGAGLDCDSRTCPGVRNRQAAQ